MQRMLKAAKLREIIQPTQKFLLYQLLKEFKAFLQTESSSPCLENPEE
jgi:hypothetical protein